MSSLIKNNVVVASGAITEDATTYTVNNTDIFFKSQLEDAVLIAQEPPSVSKLGWLYIDGAFVERQPKPVGFEDYREKRAAEYPSLIDYIDGVVKGDQAQIQAYIDACLAVKAKYPKP